MTSGALATVADISEGLEVDVERLKANLEQSGGLVMAECVSFALAEKIGKSEAHAILQELAKDAAKSSRTFRELVESDARITAHIPATELTRLFMPTSYQGSAQTFIDRLVASAQGRTTVRRSIDLLMEAKPISIRTARETAATPAAAAAVTPAPVVATPAPVPEPAPVAPPASEPAVIEKPAPIETAAIETLAPSEPVPAEPVAAAPEPEPAPAAVALAEIPPAEVPTAIAPAEPAKDGAEEPSKDPSKPSVEEPSALMEAFSRVAQATEELNASKDSDDERKAG